jgi:hypothetical protein
MNSRLASWASVRFTCGYYLLLLLNALAASTLKNDATDSRAITLQFADPVEVNAFSTDNPPQLFCLKPVGFSTEKNC